MASAAATDPVAAGPNLLRDLNLGLAAQAEIELQ